MKIHAVAIGLVAVAAIGAHAAEHAAHWGYTGEHGPGNWGGMEPGFSACKLGKMQSPIDIRHPAKSALPALDFEYVQSGAEIVNNGHTVQVNLVDGGMLNLDGVPYKLVQFHFHTPSEEKVDGKAYPMEAHLVHESADGKLAVVAVLLKEGKANPAFDTVFHSMPKAEGPGHAIQDLNAADLLPSDRGYFRYVGSLTTPPCSEGVRWQVMKQPVEVSKEQVSAFRKLYHMNARPVQALNGRKVEQD